SAIAGLVGRAVPDAGRPTSGTGHPASGTARPTPTRHGSRAHGLTGLRPERLAAPHAEAVEPVPADGRHRLQAVLRAAAEVDLAGLGEVPHRHRHVAEPEPEVDRLHQEL